MAAIEPAIRPPAQAVDDVVADGLHVESVEQHLRLAIRHVVTVFIGDEAQGAVVKHPDAAVADLHAREVAAALPEHLAPVMFAVAVLVFQDDDAVPQLRIPPHGVLRIRVVFRHPQPTLLIPAHRNGLLHIRLGGKHHAFEALGQFHRPGHLLGRHRLALFSVEGFREFIRVKSGDESEAGEKRGRAHRSSLKRTR